MRFENKVLHCVLKRQVDSVTLIDVDGCQRRGISARYAAEVVAGKEFVGYGRNGIIECVRAVDAPRRGPFATRYDLAKLMNDFPRVQSVEKNAQDPGAKHWLQQPVFAGTGRPGRQSTVHFR